MKKLIIKPENTFLLFCLATVFAVTACSTTGMQRSEDVQSTLETVDNDIEEIIVQLDATGETLDDLTSPGQGDMRQAFELFSENASEIRKMQEDFSKHADQMETSIENYLAQWEKDGDEYDNPEIQRQSNERREELGETYDKIAENNVGVKEAFQTYVSDVNEIEEFLSNDLTSDGIDSITQIADDVVNNGSRLKNELQNLQSAIEEAREKMSQG